MSSALAGGFFTTEPTGTSHEIFLFIYKNVSNIFISIKQNQLLGETIHSQAMCEYFSFN